jgi:hypothetical protein
MAGADKLALNASGESLATIDSSRPWTLWIWDVVSSELRTVINFQDRVEQILWHPEDAEILVILTKQKESLLFIWHAQKEQLFTSKGLVMNGDGAPADCKAKWLENSCDGLPLLFLSSTHSYDAGYLHIAEDTVIFQSHRDQANSDYG